MNGRFAGRAVVVTGSSRGIGKAIAARLHFEGAHLVLTAAPADARLLAEVAAGLSGAAAQVGELADRGTAEALVALSLEQFGGIDAIVNNAALHVPGAVGDIEPGGWEYALRVNLTAPMLLARAALPHLVRSGRGAIVNIGSQRAFASGHGEAAYESAKGALVALTRSLAVDYGPKGVRTNCVSPGFILSDRSKDWLAGSAGRAKAMYSTIPLGRGGTPEEVAATVAFLLSDDAAFVNGAILQVDGGALAGLPENAALSRMDRP